jgi:hypothetical protein
VFHASDSPRWWNSTQRTANACWQKLREGIITGSIEDCKLTTVVVQPNESRTRACSFQATSCFFAETHVSAIKCIVFKWDLTSERSISGAVGRGACNMYYTNYVCTIFIFISMERKVFEYTKVTQLIWIWWNLGKIKKKNTAALSQNWCPGQQREGQHLYSSPHTSSLTNKLSVAKKTFNERHGCDAGMPGSNPEPDTCVLTVSRGPSKSLHGNTRILK